MRIGRWSFAGIALVLVVSFVSAQAPGRGRGGFGGGVNNLFLLSQKSVQDELKLSEEQTKKVTALEEKQRERGREAFKGFKDLSEEEKKAKFAELAKAAQERAKETDKAIAEILKPEQVKRLKQISLQQRGARALSDAEVAEALKLSDEQKGKIKDIQESSMKEMREAGRGEDGRKKREELRKSTDEKVMGVLSAEQKTKLKDLSGEPFKGEIKRPEFGGRGKKKAE